MPVKFAAFPWQCIFSSQHLYIKNPCMQSVHLSEISLTTTVSWRLELQSTRKPRWSVWLHIISSETYNRCIAPFIQTSITYYNGLQLYRLYIPNGFITPGRISESTSAVYWMTSEENSSSGWFSSGCTRSLLADWDCATGSTYSIIQNEK